MLQKSTDLIVDGDALFKNDKFARKQPVLNLTRLIGTLSQPFVIAVEGRWGSGKTTFLRMFEQCALKDGHTCITFNAWETDFVSDPLVAFVGEMDPKLAHAVGEKSTALKGAWSKLKKAGSHVLRKGIPLALKVITHDVLDIDALKAIKEGGIESEIEEGVRKLSEARMESYFSDRKSITEFRKALQDYVLAIASDKPGGKLIFIVNELDRCRPDFAISLLERIKHFFSVDGIVFVLGVDQGQLVSAARGVYGQDLDGDGYLRKFFDLRFHLRSPEMSAFIRQLWDHFCLNSWIDSRSNCDKEIIIKALIACSELFELSLRTVEQCFTELNIVLRMTPITVEPHGSVLAFLITLRAANADLYHSFCSGTAGMQKIDNFIQLQPRHPAFYEKNLHEPILIMLKGWSKFPHDQQTFDQSMQSLIGAMQNDPASHRRYMIYSHCQDFRHPNHFAKIIERLELIAESKSNG